MQIHGSTALVTGANRGLGAQLAITLLDAGAATVYAAARDTDTLRPLVQAGGGRVVPVTLDVTDPASVRAAAAEVVDLDLLVNNAGSATFGDPLGADLAGARSDLEVNYLALLHTTRAFLPTLEAAATAGRAAAILNIVSVIALAPAPHTTVYAASKAAAHSLTQSLRATLAPRGIVVHGAYPGGIDTDMSAGMNAVKADARVVAERIVAALAADTTEIYPDDASAALAAIYHADPRQLERTLAG
ncbi:Short-chain dehydrogenase [Parafrankia irregularis]|uniref:Short-chain dehydrogenase n=1 Tax=Parafrankia irregularis TaxID=795642 RepID=A0A0S4QUB5_9ACTN|nr:MULTISPECIES: SDR family NAD(P)-dependent oxidoreductase [Parafrankia]MBE3203668.1 SDR family NAD(P)-dependent oxidoreductase [Parafrankia sp. CH37]CUU59091.1 Short-chain dehydrogenase [Parafrankia irregularis]